MIYSMPRVTVFQMDGYVTRRAAAVLAEMFNSLAEDSGEAVALDVTAHGPVGLARRDGGGSVEVSVAQALQEMADMALRIERDAAEMRAEG